MNDGPDMESRLARLAAEDERIGGARVIARAEDGRGAVLRAVATAIDETVLPAMLTLASDAPGRITILVAGRRLRAVRSAEGGLDAASLAESQLDAEDHAGVDALMTLLVSFAEGVQGPVTVTEGRGVEAGGRGLSARRISELIPDSDETGTASAATVFESRSDRFAALLGEARLACLIVDASGGRALTGDATLEDTLEAFSGIETEDVPPCLTLWVRQTGRPDGRAFARACWADGTVAALALPARATGRVVSAFRESCAD